MYTTRKTVNVARGVAISAAVSAFVLTGLFFAVLMSQGSSGVLCAMLATAVVVCALDAYRHLYTDFVYRMALLGAAHGIGLAGVFALLG